MTDDVDAERIGEKYGRALANFDDLGTFEQALTNAMTGRSYTWAADEFEDVLDAFIAAEVSSNPPSTNKQYREVRQS